MGIFNRFQRFLHEEYLTFCNFDELPRNFNFLVRGGLAVGGRQTPGSSNPVMGLPSPAGEPGTGNVKRVSDKM